MAFGNPVMEKRLKNSCIPHQVWSQVRKGRVASLKAQSVRRLNPELNSMALSVRTDGFPLHPVVINTRE